MRSFHALSGHYKGLTETGNRERKVSGTQGMHTAENNLEKYIVVFYFLKSSLSLNQDRYFALYWSFCVRISFILLLSKWSGVDLNVKPQTLFETFDLASSNSIPEYM